MLSEGVNSNGLGVNTTLTDDSVLHYSPGGHSGTEGGRTLVTYFAEEGVFFLDLRMSAIL